MGCRSSKEKDEEDDPLPTVNLLMVGLASSGKTTLLNKIKGETGSFQKQLGIDTLIVNDKVKLIAFQMAGRAYATWHHFYSTANIVIFVIDVTQISQMHKIEKILKQMDHQLPQRAKIILAFNKIDLLMQEQNKKKVESQKNHEISHITQVLNKKHEEIKIIRELKFDYLHHEVTTCKCSGSLSVGIQNLLKNIYELALKQIFRQEQQSEKKTDGNNKKVEGQVN